MTEEEALEIDPWDERDAYLAEGHNTLEMDVKVVVPADEVKNGYDVRDDHE